ncbi:uncharacterized protein BO97DRAFT_419494 [Aspergillus homomorphus CBS 101889]|uniref:Uncharacterized protein n=1 Tax=Aspergillus homomorphus (strain CBS 101889) TaxID=1450537 RepID=A0A395IBS3_ASPHC|nr:hypothetical protein BO97DRAFT_419494 [Aspergillus homomorphus CBS 101889]RAL17249.1 hypothetical protein BO97DRAFT_419494 [Aspergillus homomorphus CBS 101889]
MLVLVVGKCARSWCSVLQGVWAACPTDNDSSAHMAMTPRHSVSSQPLWSATPPVNTSEARTLGFHWHGSSSRGYFRPQQCPARLVGELTIQPHGAELTFRSDPEAYGLDDELARPRIRSTRIPVSQREA